MRKIVTSFAVVAIALAASAVWTPTQAQVQSFGEWVADRSSLYAGSVNDSGHVFAQFCFATEGSCVWLVALSQACEQDSEYSVLANSDAGAVHLRVRCQGQLEGGRYRYVFTDFSEIDNIVRRNSSLVGFAIPLQSGEFVVVRFKLRGAVAAIDAMRAAAERRATPLSETPVTNDCSNHRERRADSWPEACDPIRLISRRPPGTSRPTGPPSSGGWSPFGPVVVVRAIRTPK